MNENTITAFRLRTLSMRGILMPIVYLLAACMIGAAFAAQPGISAASARILGSPISAAALSITITFMASAALMVVGRTTPSLEMVTRLPWWVVLGGLVGVLIVAGGAVIVPVTGAAIFFICLIAGQLAGSVLLDHVGAFGSEVREVSLLRIAGLFFTLMGVLCVRYG